MGRDDHRIAALQRHHGVAHAGDDRVGAGHDAADHTQRLGNNADAGLIVLILRNVQIAHGLLAAQEVPVTNDTAEFCHLAFHVAHAALIHGHLGQLSAVVIDGFADIADDFIPLALRGPIQFKRLLCGLALCNELCNILLGFGHVVFLTFNNLFHLFIR